MDRMIGYEPVGPGSIPGGSADLGLSRWRRPIFVKSVEFFKISPY